MRRDLIFSFILVVTAHVLVAMVPHRKAKQVHTEEANVIKIDIPPPPPPDESELKQDDTTDTPVVAPPTLADIPTTVPTSNFVMAPEPPPPPGLNIGGIKVNVPRNTLRGVKIFDLADLDQQPMARFQPQPEYPFEMRRNGTEGTAVVEFICDYQGHVQEAHVIQTSGSNELDQAAIAGVTKWIFKPGRKGGKAVDARMQVPIAFHIGADSQ